ncbi:Predicted dehydrogenase [Actinopolymorpha cephalotaxi]|uniref:Dehydrogenase n=1 Tax=Actinopolymorpha cephalotaxi TaxID=504797 RepID=A0A1I3AQ32_9ACTN|nr:Gfo/Idh/MocA family oxidoreductase [Actinopolymorpha cephalotaxi]NYH86007.1 putative dehydrogenase [Actinopolymorpha cephalotaxi]SFH52164.1 Predicted dehydrogenase [Actinopolymorpha cephalotaxi]
MTRPDALRIGIAGAARGAGFVAGLRVAESAGKARLEAVYDPDPSAAERFSREYGVPAPCSSFEELLDRTDAVVLSSPQHHHTPQAIAALDAGVHVLSEVPAAVSLPQSEALVGAVRASTATYAMAENLCYTRPNLIVRSMARSGVFGDLYYGEGEYLHDVRELQQTSSGQRSWRSYWQTGRNGFTYPTHSLGPLLQWFDDRIVAVSCVGTGNHTAPEHEIDDTVILLARTRRGALLRARLDMLSNRPHLMDYFSLQGTTGAYEAARATGQEPRVYVRGRSGENAWDSLDSYAADFLPARYARQPTHAGHWGADAWPILDFIETVREGQPPQGSVPVDVYAALNMSLPGIVSETSIHQGGTWIAVPDPARFTGGIGTDPGRESPLA